MSASMKDVVINIGVWCGLAIYFAFLHVFVWGLAAWWMVEGILLFGCLYVWLYQNELKRWRRA